MKMTIDFIQGICFGIQKNKPNWLTYLDNKSINQIVDDNSSDKIQFEESLVKAVNMAYVNLAELEFKDISSDTVYLLKFDNNQKKWRVEIKNSKDAEVSLEEKNILFKDETVQKVITFISKVIFEIAATKYIKFVIPMIEEGNLLKVDEAKSEAIKDFLEDRDLRSSFEKKSFIK